MSRSPELIPSGLLRHALAGLVLQMLLSVAILVLVGSNGNGIYAAVWWWSLAGIPVWLMILHRLRPHQTARDAESIRYLMPLAEIAFAGTLFFGGSLTLGKLLKMTSHSGMVARPLPALIFAAGLTFFTLLAALYWGRMTGNGSRRELHGGAGSIMTLFPISLLVLIGTAGEYCRLPGVGWWAALITAGFCQLIAIEAGFRLICRLMMPSTPGKPLRPVYDSYFYGILRSPGDGWRTFTDVLTHQFGFDLAEGWFFQILKVTLLPLLLLTVLLLYGFSSPVMLEPAEQAVVLRFGSLTSRRLGPGLHFKAPWPFETIRQYNVAQVRRIHIGSHRPRPGETEVYRSNQAILWTNQHGTMPDELLIVAPPADLLKNTGYRGGINTESARAPSVSLAGIDIVAEYRIGNLNKYVLAGTAPDEYFRAMAEQAVSRLVCRYDIDVLFCAGRLELAARLQHELVPAATHLGLELLHVGIGGAHPPQAVAEAFQETVSAIQEKETTIQMARQYALRTMIETAGSMKLGNKLLAAILQNDALTGNTGTAVMPEELARASEGQVAQLIAEAQTYRCVRENLERGKADRFHVELNLYHKIPSAYLCWRYLAVLDNGLADAKKYLLVSDRKDLILRFDFKTPATLPSVAPLSAATVPTKRTWPVKAETPAVQTAPQPGNAPVLVEEIQ